MRKHKHLSIEERSTIKSMLDQSASFKTIARALGRDCTTISKEVRSHLYCPDYSKQPCPSLSKPLMSVTAVLTGINVRWKNIFILPLLHSRNTNSSVPNPDPVSAWMKQRLSSWMPSFPLC